VTGHSSWPSVELAGLGVAVETRSLGGRKHRSCDEERGSCHGDGDRDLKWRWRQGLEVAMLRPSSLPTSLQKLCVRARHELAEARQG